MMGLIVIELGFPAHDGRGAELEMKPQARSGQTIIVRPGAPIVRLSPLLGMSKSDF